jgi:hypothetical protein
MNDDKDRRRRRGFTAGESFPSKLISNFLTNFLLIWNGCIFLISLATILDQITANDYEDPRPAAAGIKYKVLTYHSHKVKAINKT